jgi:hypothetical protein
MTDSAKPMTELAMTVNLELGALSSSLDEQLSSQGIALRKGQDIKLFQKDADAITRCLIRGFMPESTAQRARKQLTKHIAAQCVAKVFTDEEIDTFYDEWEFAEEDPDLPTFAIRRPDHKASCRPSSSAGQVAAQGRSACR